MTWLRTDDGFPEHPKCDALAAYFGDDWATLNLAFALWHHMGCDCASRRTDGAFDSARAYRVMRAPREAIDKALAGLVKVRLLERKRDGFLFHDWTEYQPTKAQLDAERALKTARQARWRAGKTGEVDASETPPKTAGRRRVDGAVDASTSRLGDGAVEGAPSRPDPSRPDREEGSAPARAEPTPSAHGPATTPTGRSLLDAFRDAAGSRATLVGNMSEERGLARMLDRLAPSTAEVQAMADALGSPAAWWPPGKRAAPKHVTLRDLAGWKEADGEPRWAPLSALIAHVRAEAAARARREAEERAAAEAAARRAPPPEDRPQITPEAQARIDEAKRRMKAALWTYGDPPLDGAKQ